MKKPIRRLGTAREVVAAIGRERLMVVSGASTNSVTNWIAAGTFPPTLVCLMQEELGLIGCAAPRALWRQRERSGARGTIRRNGVSRVERRHAS